MFEYDGCVLCVMFWYVELWYVVIWCVIGICCFEFYCVIWFVEVQVSESVDGQMQLIYVDEIVVLFGWMVVEGIGQEGFLMWVMQFVFYCVGQFQYIVCCLLRQDVGVYYQEVVFEDGQWLVLQLGDELVVIGGGEDVGDCVLFVGFLYVCCYCKQMDVVVVEDGVCVF